MSVHLRRLMAEPSAMANLSPANERLVGERVQVSAQVDGRSRRLSGSGQVEVEKERAREREFERRCETTMGKKIGKSS